MNNTEKFDESNLKPTQHTILKDNCKFYPQLVYSWIASLTVLLNGCINGYFSSTLKNLKQNNLPFYSNETDVTIATNLASWAAILGLIVYTYFINHIGRKRTMILLVVPQMIHFISLYFIQNCTHLYISVFIGFVPSLMTQSVTSVYISEISSPHLRGSTGAIMIFKLQVGYLIGISLGWLLPIKSGVLILIAISLTSLLLIFQLPEGPYYFICRNKISRAKEVLDKLYMEPSSTTELVRLQQHIEESMKLSKGLKEIVLQPKNRRSIFVLVNLFFLKYFSGALIYLWFTPMLLSEAKYQYLSPFVCQIILLSVGSIVTFINSIFLRYVNRKTLGIICYGITDVTILLLAIYYHLKSTGNGFLNNVSDIFPFMLLLPLSISINLGVLSLPYGYFRELIPIEILAYFSFLVDMFVPICKTFAVFCYTGLKNQYSYSVCFAFFFITGLVSFLLFLKFTPETRNRVMEDVQKDIELASNSKELKGGKTLES